MEKPEFRTISLKAGLVDDIESYLTRCKRYRSIAEFVSEAVRSKLEAIEKEA
jgi:hypothetical protein